jgi:hypothetical protein
VTYDLVAPPIRSVREIEIAVNVGDTTLRFAAVLLPPLTVDLVSVQADGGVNVTISLPVLRGLTDIQGELLGRGGSVFRGPWSVVQAYVTTEFGSSDITSIESLRQQPESYGVRILLAAPAKSLRTHEQPSALSLELRDGSGRVLLGGDDNL